MITINIDKAKTIAHDKRREARSAEFAPLDIKATIPSEATAAEAARQVVRDKYAAMQTAIDAATTTDEIKAAMTHKIVVNVETGVTTQVEYTTEEQAVHDAAVAAQVAAEVVVVTPTEPTPVVETPTEPVAQTDVTEQPSNEP